MPNNPHSVSGAPLYDARGIRTREEAYDALGPNAEFGVSEHTESPYGPPGGGWAPANTEGLFRAGSDSHRLGTIPTRDMRPSPTRAPEEHYRPLDRDEKQRHSVEDIDANGWQELKGGSGKPAAPNPRATPPAEPRETSRMAPRGYYFTRPFDQHSARQMNGVHFSMADHRREYDILGMAPVRTARNTYRIEPSNWDKDIVDVPPPDRNVSYRVQSVELPPPVSRAHRLM